MVVCSLVGRTWRLVSAGTLLADERYIFRLQDVLFGTFTWGNRSFSPSTQILDATTRHLLKVGGGSHGWTGTRRAWSLAVGLHAHTEVYHARVKLKVSAAAAAAASAHSYMNAFDVIHSLMVLYHQLELPQRAYYITRHFEFTFRLHTFAETPQTLNVFIKYRNCLKFALAFNAVQHSSRTANPGGSAIAKFKLNTEMYVTWVNFFRLILIQTHLILLLFVKLHSTFFTVA